MRDRSFCDTSENGFGAVKPAISRSQESARRDKIKKAARQQEGELSGLGERLWGSERLLSVTFVIIGKYSKVVKDLLIIFPHSIHSKNLVANLY
ncbi:hypothetical protein TNCV_3643881 [Trichonephila clavipes]|nr:hypothetical protein TNCV_3643881 [Trichonephila clavipes]